jgi:hypothetical protein
MRYGIQLRHRRVSRFRTKRLLIRSAELTLAGSLLVVALAYASSYTYRLMPPHAVTVNSIVKAKPVPSVAAKATPAPQLIVTPIANVNIHSTPEATSVNFVVTAWLGRPVTVLAIVDANWYQVQYVTTTGETVTGYMLRSLTSQP